MQPARKAWASLKRRSLDIHVLMVVAVAGAMAIGEWAEGATVVCLFAVSQWLEVRTMERAREAIRAVMTLAPTEARVKSGGHEHRDAGGDGRPRARPSSCARARRFPSTASSTRAAPR